MEDVWKQFEQNPISHSAAHHIIAIDELLERHGYARVSDVAKLLNITRGSASLTLKALKQRGLVVEDNNRFLKLSEEGERLASSVRGRAFLMRRFFIDVLDIPSEDAEIDACKIEHLISLATAERLALFLRYFSGDDPKAVAFRESWQGFEDSCNQDPVNCPACETECVNDLAAEAGSPMSARQYTEEGR